MAIALNTYQEVVSSGEMESATASIALTPEMFELLSSGIYEDKALAIVRELSCNARDTMLEEAMNKGIPVEELGKIFIEIPTAFEPTFSIRDYGTGLSKEGMFRVFLGYGYSTKTNSNDFIGMYGIGSKSPLSYTDSFIVTSYQDGKMSMYNIYKDNGIPKISEMAVMNTEEPNGLKVSVAVRKGDYITFQQRISRFFKLFNFPVEFSDNSIDTEVEYLIKTDKYHIVNHYQSGVFALMGGVPYEIPHHITSKLKEVINANSILLPFEIGSLKTSSSRETLSFIAGDDTCNRLTERVEDIVTTYYQEVEDSIQGIDNVWEVMDTLINKYNLSTWSMNYSNLASTIKWRGTSIKNLSSLYKNKMELATPGEEYISTISKYRYDRTTSCTMSYYKIVGAICSARADFKQVLIVNEDETKNFAKGLKNIVLEEKYLVLKNVNKAIIPILKEMVGEDNVVVWNFADVAELFVPKPKPRKKSESVKVSGVFSFTLEDGWKEVTEMDSEDDTYYVDMIRNEVIFTMPQGNEKELNKGIFEDLVRAGKFNKIYFIRKSSSKKLLSKNLQKLTYAHIKSRIGKKAIQALIFWTIRCGVMPIRKSSVHYFDGIMEKGSYPTMTFYNREYSDWQAKHPGLTTWLQGFYYNVMSYDSAVEATIQRSKKRYIQEYNDFNEKFSFYYGMEYSRSGLSQTSLDKLYKVAKMVASGELVL